MNSHQKRKERRQKERDAMKLNFSVSHNPTIKGEYNLNRQVEEAFNNPKEEDMTPVKLDWHPKIHYINRTFYERWCQNIYCYFADHHCRFCLNHGEEICCNCGNEMPLNIEQWDYWKRRRG